MGGLVGVVVTIPPEVGAVMLDAPALPPVVPVVGVCSVMRVSISELAGDLSSSVALGVGIFPPWCIDTVLTVCDDQHMRTNEETETTTGFICKRCGAESPVGIGYAGEPVSDVPAAGCPNFHEGFEPRAFVIIAETRRVDSAGNVTSGSTVVCGMEK